MARNNGQKKDKNRIHVCIQQRMKEAAEPAAAAENEEHRRGKITRKTFTLCKNSQLRFSITECYAMSDLGNNKNKQTKNCGKKK